VQAVITMPLMKALYPFIGKAFSDNKENGLVMVQKFMPLIIFLTGSAAIFMLFAGPLIMHIFYGDAFKPAVKLFQIMAFVPMFIAISYFLGVNIMLNLKMDKLFFRVTASGAALSILLNVLMIKKWGSTGSAINWIVTEIFITICMYVILYSKGIKTINFHYWKPSVIIDYIKPAKK